MNKKNRIIIRRFKTKQNKIKMSIDKKQILHIASEIIIIGGISIYFFRKNNQLVEQINILEHKVQQQELIIQNHEQLLLKLLNNVNLLNNNINLLQQQQQNQKVLKNEKQKQPPSNIKSTKSDNIKSDKKNHDIMMNHPPHNFSQSFPNNLRIDEPQIIIMPLFDKEKKTNSPPKVEEIFEDLDKELENELNELNFEISEPDYEISEPDDDEIPETDDEQSKPNDEPIEIGDLTIS